MYIYIVLTLKCMHVIFRSMLRFLQQIDMFIVVPSSVQTPLNRTVQFNCTIVQGELQWIVRIKNSLELFWPFNNRNLQASGVYAVYRTTRDSILYINATQKNNATQVQCAAAVNASLNRSEKTNLTVFGEFSCRTMTRGKQAMHQLLAITCNYLQLLPAGPPTAPTNLSVSFFNDTHAYISWIPPFVLQGTQIWYTLYAREVAGYNNTQLDLAFEGAVTTTSYLYKYHNQDIGTCTGYQFGVKALNEAGASLISWSINTGIPTRKCACIQ